MANPTTNLRILVVDDERAIVELVCERLELDGHVACGVTSAAEARAIAATEEFDVVITDVRMPGGDGVELIRSLRADGFSGPVLVITGHSGYTHDELREQGAAEVIEKPFRHQQLMEFLRRHVAPLGAPVAD